MSCNHPKFAKASLKFRKQSCRDCKPVTAVNLTTFHKINGTENKETIQWRILWLSAWVIVIHWIPKFPHVGKLLSHPFGIDTWDPFMSAVSSIVCYVIEYIVCFDASSKHGHDSPFLCGFVRSSIGKGG